MANLTAGNVAGYGILVGTTAIVAGIKPKTQKGEHLNNKARTAIGLGGVAFLPYAAKKAAKANPVLVDKIALKTGTFIEKAAKYVAKNAPKVVAKIKGTKVGAKVLDGLKTFAVKVAKKTGKFLNSNPKYKIAVRNVVKKVANGIEKFAKAPTATKGKYALITGGAALLAYTALKGVTNYYKKEGAIDQKYADLKA